MKTKQNLTQFCLLGVLLASLATQAATITWTNSASGGWNTAANWNPNVVPGANDTAIISRAGVTVALNSDTTVRAIVLGTNGAGKVTLNWTGGVLAGSMTVASNSSFNIAFGGGNTAEFNGFILTNYGTVNWANTTIHGVNGNNQRIYNYGLWNEQGDDYFAGAYNGGSALFDNFGTFRKSGTTGQTTLDGAGTFTNTGIVEVQSGTLDITGGLNSGGTFSTSGAGTMVFYGCTFNNTTTFTGPGNFLRGDTTFRGIILGTLNWVGNNVLLAGNLTVASNSVLNIVFGGGLAMFRGCVLTNYGTVNWSNTDIHGVDGYNEQIYNYGVWNAQSDNTFSGAFNGGTALFENFGTFLKSGNKGVTTLDAGSGFNNPGLVQVQSGTLAISGGTSSGGFSTDNGGIINFSGCLFTNTTTFTGTGSSMTGDTIFGGTMVGTLNWAGNGIHLAGTLTVASNSVFNITGGGLVMFNGCVLTNYGTVIWNNAEIHGVNGNNQQIYNYGVWNAQSDNAFSGTYNGGSALFDNFGTFRKSGSSGVTTLSAGMFNNTGTLDAQSGNITLQGTYTLANGTQMSFGLGGPTGNGSISLFGTASFAGNLSVNLNSYYWPAVGSSFNLLNYSAESGVLFTNATLPAPGYLAWQTNYNATAFALALTARTATNTVATNLNLSTLNGTNLILQWPGDHTGWRIQAQTNPATTGFSTNWVTLAGSNQTNQLIETINKTNGAVFFRMVTP